jgi:cell division protein FtsW
VKLLTKYFKGDTYVWVIVLFLSFLGLAAVYSSTGALAFRRMSGNTEYYFVRQSMFIIIGIGLMYLCHLVDYKYFSKIARYLVYVAIPVLVLTLLLGSELNAAKRQITIPIIGISFQSFDFAKFALIIYIARFLSRKQGEVKSWKTFRTVFTVILVVCGLMAPEDLSSSLVLFATSLALLFIGRINLKYLAGLVGIGALCFTIFVSFLFNISADTDRWDGTRVMTWKSRLETYLIDENDDSYQTQQAKIAVSTGGLFGKGPGNSVQRNYLPHPYSDFIYAIVIEEYGLLFGALPLLLAFLILLFRSIRVVIKSPNAFGALLSVGLSFSLAVQAFVNMGVAVSLLPVTGLTLPLVSMGGTSMIFTSLAFGLILSVSRTVEKETLEHAEAAA